jgi:hypothetical protein
MYLTIIMEMHHVINYNVCHGKKGAWMQNSMQINLNWIFLKLKSSVTHWTGD